MLHVTLTSLQELVPMHLGRLQVELYKEIKKVCVFRGARAHCVCVSVYAGVAES